MLTAILIATFIAIWGAWALFHFRDTQEGIRLDAFFDVQTEMSVRGETDDAANDLMTRYPKRPEPIQLWIEVANRRSDWPEMARRARVLREKFPRNPEGYSQGATALLQGGNRADAEALLEEGIKRLGNQSTLLVGLGHIARNDGDLPTAVERYAAARRVFPDVQDGYTWGAEALLALGRREEAEGILAAGIDGAKICQNEVALSRYAECAEIRQDWPEASRRWAMLQEYFPVNPNAYLGHAAALSRLGERQKAEKILDDALVMFPKNDQVVAAEAAIRAIPINPSKDGPIDAQNIQSPRRSFVPFKNTDQIVRRTGLSATELVLKFDTIGEGCEFGFVQRRFGAEPISLMRFAGISWECMAKALNSGFEGIGAPDNVAPGEEDTSQWDIRELRYGIFYHTFLKSEAITREKLLRTQSRRLGWLADKLLNDLQEGKKIFVAFRTDDERTGEITPLIEAVRLRGAATILWVEQDDGIPGVEEIEPGFLRGRIRWLTRPGRPDLDADGWLAMLANAWILQHGEARSAFAEASGDEANDPGAAQMPASNEELARAEEARGEHDSEELHLREAIATNPNHWWLHTSLASNLLAQGRYDEAGAALASVEASFPDEPEVFATRARAARLAGRRDEALALWDRVIEKFPDVWVGYNGKVISLVERGPIEEADAFLGEAASRFPRDIGAAHDLARMLERHRSWERAEAAWKTFIALDPPRAGWPYEALTHALREQHKFGAADRTILDAMDKFPGEPKLREAHGLNAMAREDWDEATRRLEDGKRIFPREPAFTQRLDEVESWRHASQEQPREPAD